MGDKMTEKEAADKRKESEAILARWAEEAAAQKKKEDEAKAAIERKAAGALEQGARALTGGSRTARMLKKIED